MNKHYVENQCLSTAWLEALHLVFNSRTKEVRPLITSITGFNNSGDVQENNTIKNQLDNLLKRHKSQSIKTVANTIFPISMWNPKKSRCELFSRYNRIIPKLKEMSPKNRHGLYFQKMISMKKINIQKNYKVEEMNQLEFIINLYQSRTGVRRSVLQIAIFDPHVDHTKAAQKGFPCLQHITFSPCKKTSTLSVNAFYANHYIVERAYGNYLGLCNLGKFIAYQLRLRLSRVTCFAGIAQCDINSIARELVK